MSKFYPEPIVKHFGVKYKAKNFKVNFQKLTSETMSIILNEQSTEVLVQEQLVRGL